MKRATVALPEQRWRIAGLIVFTVAGCLLLSMGAAIVAAPLTAPLLFLVSRRHPTGPFRVAAAVLGGLTVAEVVWALTYLQVEEAQPWIWLLPLLGGITAAIVLGAGAGSRRRGLVTK